MSEKKDSIDSFFDILQEGADKLESTLKHAHHPDKNYDAVDAEVIAFETQSPSSRVRQMAVELSSLGEKYESNISISSALNSASNYAFRAALSMESQESSKKALKP